MHNPLKVGIFNIKWFFIEGMNMKEIILFAINSGFIVKYLLGNIMLQSVLSAIPYEINALQNHDPP